MAGYEIVIDWRFARLFPFLRVREVLVWPHETTFNPRSSIHHLVSDFSAGLDRFLHGDPVAWRSASVIKGFCADPFCGAHRRLSCGAKLDEGLSKARSWQA